MIIEFSASNFRSIKEKQTISLLPSDRVKTMDRKNFLFPIGDYKDLNLLTAAIISGKNAAGKSNIIKAFRAFKWLVLNSHRFTQGDVLMANEYFEFDVQMEGKPTIFEIDFVAEDGFRYFYLVEFTKIEILKEELYFYPKTTTKTTNRRLFTRQKGKEISFGEDFRGARKSVEERTRPNCLFLSKSIHENNIFLEPIFAFFKKGLNISDFGSNYNDFRLQYFAHTVYEGGSNELEALSSALRSIDSGILALSVLKSENLPKNIKVEEGSDEVDEQQRNQRERLLEILKTQLRAVHKKFDGEHEIGTHELPFEQESEGTQKFVAVFTAFMDQIKNGTLFVVDEFEKSFHPLITKMLVGLFANKRVNVNGAQLIFTSHDANLLDVFDNDQIHLVQKDETGATEVYAVSDIRGLRSDLSAGRRYLRGDFEAIPNINQSPIEEQLAALHD